MTETVLVLFVLTVPYSTVSIGTLQGLHESVWFIQNFLLRVFVSTVFYFSHQQSTDATISEILLVGLGPAHRATPYLFAVVDDDLVVYSGFPFHDHVPPNHLHLRFSKVM